MHHACSVKLLSKKVTIVDRGRRDTSAKTTDAPNAEVI